MFFRWVKRLTCLASKLVGLRYRFGEILLIRLIIQFFLVPPIVVILDLRSNRTTSIESLVILGEPRELFLCTCPGSVEMRPLEFAGLLGRLVGGRKARQLGRRVLAEVLAVFRSVPCVMVRIDRLPIAVRGIVVEETMYRAAFIPGARSLRRVVGVCPGLFGITDGIWVGKCRRESREACGVLIPSVISTFQGGILVGGGRETCCCASAPFPKVARL